MNLKKLWRDYNLGIVLFILFAASWLLHGVFNWFYVMNEAVQHGQPFQVSEF